MAKDPFVEEYLKGMAAVRKSRPKKRAKLSLGKGTKVEPRFLDELKVENRYQPRERNPQTNGDGSSLTAGYDTKTDQAFRAIGNALGNQGPTEALRFVDNNLLGIGNAEQAAFNVGRGEGTGWDAVDLAFAAPVAGAVAKPFGALARGVGRVASPLAARVAEVAPMQYLREARPLVDSADDAIQTAFSVTPGAQRRITNQRPRVQGLPAPEQRLGLPAPGPGLPEYAAKPRGGQWWSDQSPYWPMNPLKATEERLGLKYVREFNPEFAGWMEKALPRYLQNDFATPDDPLRALADLGYLQGVENAAQWSNMIKNDIAPMPLQKLLFDDKTSKVRDEALAAMPWLNKLPQTDTVYGVWPRERTVETFEHVNREMRNALDPQSGLPADLAVRPESLARMSFPQAVERVGRINQWRAKQAEQAQLSAMNSPAVQMFKEYPDDPNGMRWVELRAPEAPTALPEGYSVAPSGKTNFVYDPDGNIVGSGDTPEAAAANALPLISGDVRRGPLQDALRYEGDTMGHCVGGYCDDVLSGRSRIFSLRDAKGEPHVTIETGRNLPGRNWDGLRHQLDDDASDAAYDAAMQALKSRGDTALFDAEGNLSQFGNAELNREMDIFAHGWLSKNGPEDIVQIKGKQNRAPKEDYLPFVQDFVKSGQWGDIGDLGNTGLVKLPDGRLINKDQWRQGVRQSLIARNPVMPEARLNQLLDTDYGEPTAFHEDLWDSEFARYFEGYARGGRVQNLAAKPCSCDKSLAVR